MAGLARQVYAQLGGELLCGVIGDLCFLSGVELTCGLCFYVGRS